MDDTEMAIHVRGLQKHFGKVHALRGLDLDVPTGQVTGFLGPNGAGKSTTIRIVLGLLRSNGGMASVLGGDPWRDAVQLHRRIAYVPGEVSMWPNLTGGETIDVLCKLSGAVERTRKQELLERFALDPTKKTRSYSKGNKQKVALVAAFATDAELLVLDEPTSGLDPLMVEEFTRCVQEACARGCSVLLSSHVFAEVERLADSAVIIKDGQTVESGTLAQLRHLTRTEVSAQLGSVPADLGAREGIHDFQAEGGAVRFFVDEEHLPQVLARISSLSPHSLRANPPSLEEIFLRHYAVDEGGGNHGGAALKRS